jgi:hypothetical protein
MTKKLWGAQPWRIACGRGFHYQDAVVPELVLLAWRGELPTRRLVPEGLIRKSTVSGQAPAPGGA